MAIQSHPTAPPDEHAARRRFPDPLTVIILLAAFILGVIVITQPGAAPEIEAPVLVEQTEGDYSGSLAANPEAMALYHQSEWDRTPDTTVPFGAEALAIYHQSEWDRTPPTKLRLLDEAALAEYHQSEWDRTPDTTVPLGAEALAIYHQSEWDRTPHPTSRLEALRLEAKALAVYHQSEWDRTPPTKLRLLDEAALSKYHQSEWSR